MPRPVRGLSWHANRPGQRAGRIPDDGPTVLDGDDKEELARSVVLTVSDRRLACNLARARTPEVPGPGIEPNLHRLSAESQHFAPAHADTAMSQNVAA